jgi:LacI family transcriptional regulator
MSRITIKDIARLLQVNPSTVSRALKDHPDISIDMRVKVKEVATELGYRPNYQAIHFRKKKSGLIGLILPDMNMFFFPMVMKAIEEEIRKHGYNLVVFQSGESLEQEIQNLEICKGFGVEGVLVSISKETQNGDHFEDFMLDDVPVIFFDKVIENEDFPRVVIHDEAAAYKAVGHLLEKGHRHICGFFDDLNLNITQQRFQGFHKAQADFGIKTIPDFSLFTKNLEEARHVFRSFLKTHPTCDAVFTMSDELLAVAMEVIYEMDKKIPEDIAIIGISEGQLPYFLQPKITHIQHSGYEVGKRAAALLLEVLRNKKMNYDKRIIVETHLVKLDSV